MDWLTIVLTVAGLSLFETVSSIDNAIINAEVLHGMSPTARRWFLLWGMLFAVFILRGVLPWLIVWLATPGFGPIEALTATFSSDPLVLETIERAAPALLAGGGTFLLFLFFQWLFLESKTYGLPGERFFERQGIWFYAVISVLLAILVGYLMQNDPARAFGAVLGSTVFFITHGFKQNAEQHEQKLLEGKGLSDISKIFYLEVIDATFSIDGVLGAFAFTLSVPLILVGNGIGAFVVRQVTVGNIERIKKYVFLKNGAMYSVLVLGMVMVAEALDVHVPTWLSPVATFAIVGYFFVQSRRRLGQVLTDIVS